MSQVTAVSCHDTSFSRPLITIVRQNLWPHPQTGPSSHSPVLGNYAATAADAHLSPVHPQPAASSTPAVGGNAGAQYKGDDVHDTLNPNHDATTRKLQKEKLDVVHTRHARLTSNAAMEVGRIADVALKGAEETVVTPADVAAKTSNIIKKDHAGHGDLTPDKDGIDQLGSGRADGAGSVLALVAGSVATGGAAAANEDGSGGDEEDT
uniref:SMP domain-containing protein n=1 Tax=Mycena chlorophos TaxID=658473 RepID=A0ABQ0L9W1_MYCCL|nr:predicted protein [Mycena chlorophos]